MLGVAGSSAALVQPTGGTGAHSGLVEAKEKPAIRRAEGEERL